MYVDNVIKQNLLKRLTPVAGATGVSILAANATRAYGIAELTISSSANALITVKIGTDTVLLVRVLANDSKHMKFYEKVLLEADPLINKAITATFAGGGTIEVDGTYVEIAKV